MLYSCSSFVVALTVLVVVVVDKEVPVVVEVVVDVMRVKPVLWLVWCGCAVDIDLCGCWPVLVDLFMRVF